MAFALALIILSLSYGSATCLLRGASGKQEPGYEVFRPKALPENLSVKRPIGVHFLRIQKTGGTTFGEHILRKFCGAESDVCKWAWHLDWTTSTEHWQGPVVTFLRDPVERTLSEFAFLRTKDGNQTGRQEQWDFRNGTWFDSVSMSPDADDALSMYLQGYPDNPSRNRQTLYLLGFKQWTSGGPVPRYTYDWEVNHDQILEEAKEHLRSMVAFGITDCFLPSVRVLAKELGYPTQEVMAVAKHTHARKYSPDMITPTSMLQVHNVGRNWRSTVDEDVVSRIEQLNAVDMELYKFALQLFNERYNERCI